MIYSATLSSDTSSADPSLAVAEDIHRFEFETEQQFCQRICPTPVVSQPTPVPTAEAQSESFFLIPAWGIVIIILLLIIGFYENHRRQLMKVLQQWPGRPPARVLPHPKTPKSWEVTQRWIRKLSRRLKS